MIPYGRQDISTDDIEAVVEVLNSDFLTQGQKVPAFEEAVAKASGAAHAVAVNSATSALHIACMALGVGPGDRVWTSPITFVASANSALYCGAEVDFVDVDARSYNMCPKALEAKLQQAEASDQLPKVVIPVHLCGQSCDMEAIGKLALRYGFKVIEDASHAIGGAYQDQPVGSGRYSDITVFSFHPVKIVTTAEGGVAVTNDAALAQKMGLARSHGVTRDPDLMVGESDGPWYYQQVDLGYNYRMTELQAALGLSQMTRLEEFVSRRHVLAKRYNMLLADLPLILPWQHPETYSGLHLYVVQVDDRTCDLSRRQVFEALRAAGIGVNVHYIPVHTQPYYRDLRPQGYDPLPNAMGYYSRAISLPMFPTMTEEQQDQVVSALTQILN
ncbi:putative DegT/DnrJ/EryC1/StrS aminotransferase [Roseobacter sp. SK209-2-6]|uniref:UDP-4-amino-4, 6-dideoxy-N-acetyl-beta-L-altrosamine transaminase n=1 Tax=Roseobacter sp. SK209-2-6 TaxID=388739 RepID=UPI0000F3F1E9|nr:UDP-4-amino-4,6-dideoxy-N-acetyl-beta-L-altrosamine transaminase [Roseobacter sp. SK209-2-6]EBA14547.1 putative DegT/DnrJ/EryC1/StrS aminotransferase [Roseobacter sp. SK209-2-6]